MSSKVIQLEFPGMETNLNVEDTIKNMLRGLFARDTVRKNEIKNLMKRNLELEEIIFRMNSRIDRALNLMENP